MAYAKGTGLPINGYVKRGKANPARVGAGVAVPSTGSMIYKTVGVNRKPGRNKATK